MPCGPTRPDTLLHRLDLDKGDPAHPDRLPLCGRPTPTLRARLQQHLTCVDLPFLGIRSDTPDVQWDHAIDPDGT